MRQFSIITLLISLIFFSNSLPSYSAIKGRVHYALPIEYDKLSEQELNDKAKVYYHNALQYSSNNINDDITMALMLYNILQKINQNNTDYAVKTGVLYDKLDKDRHAKGNFSKAIRINSSLPDAYFYFGEFYYKREMYRDALRYYKQAYNKGYNTHYDTLYRMGDIFQKFGDSRSSLKYLNEALAQSPNPDVIEKIQAVELLDSNNREFYSSTRIKQIYND